MLAKGELFLPQMRETQLQDNFGVLATPNYSEARMSRKEANDISWEEFRHNMMPLATIALGGSGVECIITEKAVPWGAEDVNVFVGQKDRQIYELDDFEIQEGESFLDLNFAIAEGLLAEGQRKGVQVTVGFNRGDLSVGHHSVLKLHSHIRVAPNEIDINHREISDWQSLSRFDKLAFIEPFSPLFHDYITRAVQVGRLSQFVVGEPRDGVGYTALEFERSANLPKIFEQLKWLYQSMKAEYATIADVFTDGSVDPMTERFIPRSREDRVVRLERFLRDRGDFYSPQSIDILCYLAEHIQAAVPRSPTIPTDMSSTAMIYLTRGFAGAITFAFEKYSDTVRMDFLPRVITTSTPTKTMMGETLPAVIDRTANSAATDEEQRIMHAYQREVVGILEDIVPPEQFVKVNLHYE